MPCQAILRLLTRHQGQGWTWHEMRDGMRDGMRERGRDDGGMVVGGKPEAFLPSTDQIPDSRLQFAICEAPHLLKLCQIDGTVRCWAWRGQLR